MSSSKGPGDNADYYTGFFGFFDEKRDYLHYICDISTFIIGGWFICEISSLMKFSVCVCTCV